MPLPSRVSLGPMAKRVPEGPAPEPVVQRLRVRYAKRGRMRFTSTRDFQRALERALRRAGVPMAYSAGFHPHPRISYANAAPTGAASESEYVELALTRTVDPADLAASLDAALPTGLDVVSVVEADPGALADRLQASVWSMEFPGEDPTELARAVDRLLAQEVLEVTRVMKRGPRQVDVRAALVSAGVHPDGPGSRLEVTVRHTTPTIRPEEIWHALARVTGREPARPRSTRLAQGELAEDGTVRDPLTG